MSRYLTPAKIGLLSLISVYCESEVPTASIVPILSFIASKVIVKHDIVPEGQSGDKVVELDVPISEFERVLADHGSNMPGRSLLDTFLMRIWSIQSLDSLHEFFDKLEDLLATNKEDLLWDGHGGRIKLSKSSPLGIFTRRARLEFLRLQFHDSIKLWMAFLKYKEPTLRLLRKRHPEVSDVDFDSNISDLGIESGDGLLQVAYGRLRDPATQDEMVSIDDVERLLEFQIEKLQRFGTRIPGDMKARFQSMIAPAFPVPSISHFVKFFDGWRAGDYTSAFDNLHRYFDYTMQTRDKTYYQYALLHMAVLHADFGCFSEACAAMTETIATARENQDMSCLNFSLSWLNHLAKAYSKEMKAVGFPAGMGSERDALHYLKTKAKDSRSYNLLSTALLSEAKLGLANGESVPRVFELMYQASHVNVQYNVETNIGGQMLLQSAIYGRLGVSHLANVHNEMLLECYRNTSPTEEIVRAICRDAFSKVQSGQYDQGLRTLEEVPHNYHQTLKFHQYIMTYTVLLRLRRALRRCDLVASAHLLRHVRKGTTSSDPEISFQISVLEIEHLVRSGSLDAAFAKLEQLSGDFKDGHADVYARITVLNMKARLYAEVGKAHKGFSLALRAASAAQKARLLPSMWTAVGLLANVLNQAHESKASQRLLDSVIPQALEGGDSHQCAYLYSLQADVYIALANDESTRRQGSMMGRAEVYADLAREHYKRIEDINGECEMLAKKAVISRWRGDQRLADDWAANYVATHEKAMQRNREERDLPE